MQGLKKFLTEDAMMSKKQAGQYVRDLRKVDGFDDSAAEKLTSHLEKKFNASFWRQSYDDPDDLKQFLSVNNLGEEIWQREQRYDDFFNQWGNRNFIQHNDLDRYSEYYNEALSKALNGKKVDYDDIGRKLQRDATMRDAVNDVSLNELSPMEIEQARQAGYDLKTPGSIRDAIDYTRGYKQKMAENATGAGQVNKIFLNARSSEEARQAALDLFNEDVKTQKQILKKYFNKTGIKEDTFNEILEKANMTDDEIENLAIKSSSKGKTQEKKLENLIASRQFANDPTVENLKNMRKRVSDDTAKDFVENFQRYKALKQEDEIRQKISNGSWGSGKTLQEAAGSAQDQAVASAASDFSGAFPSFEKAMSGDGNVSLDRAILRSKMGGDPSDWGFEGGSNYLLTNQEKGFNKFIKNLRKSNASPEEKQKLFNDKVLEIQKNIAEGPGMSDFFFGNQLHTGAIGAAAIMGTMGVAFGGRKSNAELYSSPF